MDRRLELQEHLEMLLGATNVYFQPPATIKMIYPAIVYERDDLDTLFANNMPYRHIQRYQVTVITRDADSLVPGKIANLPSCSFSRFFVEDNLNHDVYSLYF